MPELRPCDRRVKGRLVEFHPTRTFVGYGPRPIIQQDEKYWFIGGKEVDETEVPAELLEYAKKYPQAAGEIPSSETQRLEVCKHCGEAFTDRDFKSHMYKLLERRPKARAAEAVESE